ncbi:unnamed protein product [Soboliphyme baturini]|uniref:HTH cro/C1-type domain-containing protein n=1 Tax=Soboliphyme baturini TaxID=241478 RepID=A0A183IX07_9BILA|nr:unnamed protein product [Soboliphyme baturini]
MALRSDTEWDTVTVLRKRPPKASELRDSKTVNQAQRLGKAVDTTKKFNAATNKQHVAVKDISQLDNEFEDMHHDKIPLEIGRLIQSGRQAKEWSQSDLAKAINEKLSIVNDYEAGRAVLNQQILGKIERAIEIKLRGKDKGKPLPHKPPKAEATKGGQKKK